MKEHVNFFTPKSIRILAESNNFSVIDIQTNREGNSSVLSMLFQKNPVVEEKIDRK